MKLLSILLLTTCFLWANEQTAKSFLLHLGSTKTVQQCETLYGNTYGSEIAIASLCQLQNKGYILLSLSRDLSPIRAYSLQNDFNDLPSGYRQSLIDETEALARTVSQNNYRSIDSPNSRYWDYLEQLPQQPQSRSYTPDTYLLSTRWGQGYPFNKNMPTLNGEEVVVGCTNTAMAQLMYYYQYPEHSTGGLKSYSWNGTQLGTIFNTPYQWSLMETDYSDSNSKIAEEAVAILFKDLVVSNSTDLNTQANGGSGSVMMVNNLIRHFGYSTSVASIQNSDSQFYTTVKNEIDAERPVLLSMPGHATVIDGYANDGTGRKFHINMGWEGTDDNYYYLDSTITTTYYIFPPSHTAYYNIRPCSGSDCENNFESGDTYLGSEISGSFDYEYDTDYIDVYLGGQTQISGTRGFSNQGFYLTLYDAEGNLIQTSDTTISRNLTPGWFRLEISLQKADGSHLYSLQNGFNHYTVTYTTTASSDETTLSYSPVINNNLDFLFLTPSSPGEILLDIRDPSDSDLDISIQNEKNSQFSYSLDDSDILNISSNSEAIGLFTLTGTNDQQQSVSKSFYAISTDTPVFSGEEFTISDTFSDQNSVHSHQLILEGSCTVTGYNGYSNQAFYTKLSDLQGNLYRDWSDSSIQENFSLGLYTIESSLSDGSSYYGFDESTEHYTLTVRCSNYGPSIQELANILGINYEAGADEQTTPTPPEQPLETTLTLQSGWNLIALPVSQAEYSTSELESNVVIWGYQNGTWNYRPTIMEVGMGYWAYANQIQTLSFSGESYTPDLSKLNDGWHLLGTGETIDLSTQGFQASWNYTNGQWNVFPTVTAGQGFWVKP